MEEQKRGRRSARLPENYDDTIFEGYEHYDESGWSEKVYTPVTTSAMPPEPEPEISWVPAEKWEEKQVPTEARGATQVVGKPSTFKRFLAALNLSWFDTFALVLLIANLIGFGKAYFDSNLVQLIFFGVASILFALAFLQKK